MYVILSGRSVSVTCCCMTPSCISNQRSLSSEWSSRNHSASSGGWISLRTWRGQIKRCSPLNNLVGGSFNPPPPKEFDSPSPCSPRRHPAGPYVPPPGITPPREGLEKTSWNPQRSWISPKKTTAKSRAPPPTPQKLPNPSSVEFPKSGFTKFGAFGGPFP